MWVSQHTLLDEGDAVSVGDILRHVASPELRIQVVQLTLYCVQCQVNWIHVLGGNSMVGVTIEVSFGLLYQCHDCYLYM